MSRRHHALPFGAEVQPDGRTRFRLWAPNAASVTLVRSDSCADDIVLGRDGGGWFEATTDCGTGTRYRYRIDDDLAVPDPAARFNPEGLAGPSEVIDPHAYEWTDDRWQGLPWHRTVLYELHVGAFTNEGTYAAAAARLANLAALGINTIELMPLATYPGSRGWGYDGVLPFAPHPTYGRPEDLKRLIDAAHAHGIAVVLDVVYNHFGPQGNYLPHYASAFFTQKYTTPWGSAINFEGTDGRHVRDFFIQNALYWLNEYRLDGLRLDAIHAIRDASDPHFIDELRRVIENGPGCERYVHLILENHDNEPKRLRASERVSVAQWNDDFHHVAHVIATGEGDGYYSNYVERPLQRLGRVLAEGFDYQGEPYGTGEPRGERSADLPATAFIDFLQNHDQIGNRAFGERLAVLTSTDTLRSALSLLLLSPHVPMLFMGEEYGATQPFLYFCDYDGDLARAITEGRRAEFAQFKVFADPAVRARIPDPNAAATFECSRLRWEEREQGAHRQALEYVATLLRLRSTHIVPLIPQLEPGMSTYIVEQDLVSVQWPTRDRRRVLQLEANLGPQRRDSKSTAGDLIHSSNASGAANSLAPWEVRWQSASWR